MESSTSWLHKWKKNEIFEAIQAVGLDPREFELEDDQLEVRIKHKLSESCFVVGGNPSHYVGRHVVGDAPEWPFDAYSWQAIIPRFRGWLEDVRRDLATPDLWAELQRETDLLRTYSDDIIENTPFTSGEQNEIASQLQAWADRTRRES